MKRFEKVKLLEDYRRTIEPSKRVGFVPTMGALHEGHLSLVAASKKENDYTIVSIFVNPTQFNDPKDLEKYPRTLEEDIRLLSPYEIDALFIPDTGEMYVSEELEQVFSDYDLLGLDEKLEGAHRPGHFNGVVQIVSKFLKLVRPTHIYLGQKDYQQFLILKRLTELMGMGTKAVMMPILREKNGLAMSSRNQQLSEEEREEATVIYQVLSHIDTTIPLATSIQQSKDEIAASPICKHIEYFEIIDADTLASISSWEETSNRIALVAIQTDKIRLIDNMFI